MKIQIFSDLHADVRPIKNIVVKGNVDYVVCAGDVCEGMEEAFTLLRQFLTPVITVAGNHSFYNRDYKREIQRAEEIARFDQDMVFLNNSMIIDTRHNVRFIGCTLWTDYKLYGEANAFACIQAAKSSLNDYRFVNFENNKGQIEKFTPTYAQFSHIESVRILEHFLAQPFDGKTIILTHHAPSPRSIHSKYAGQLLNAAFVSDLEWLIEKYQPDLFVHGHTHASFDYHIGKTRVICNPHGYGNENPEFDPQLVIEV